MSKAFGWGQNSTASAGKFVSKFMMDGARDSDITYMDFVQGLDPSKLVLAETVLSFAVSPFISPPYNLAIFLFGIYSQEHVDAIHSLRIFTGFVGVSAVFDVVWMSMNKQNGFIKFLSILIFLLKVPTFFAFGLNLHHRGAAFSGLGGSDLNGPTIWSMPGGFASANREGYQTVDEERPANNSRPLGPAPLSTAPSPQGAYQVA